MINKHFTHLLFDLDGTLSDNSDGIIGGIIYSLKSFGFEIPDRHELVKFIGPPLSETFRVLCGFDENGVAEAVNRYRTYYRKTGIFENRMYDGVPEMLKELKNSGYHLYVATSKPEEFARKICAHFGIDKYFDFIGGATFDGVRGKKSDVIKYVIDECKIPREGVLMIGDRFHDIEGAHACGIPALGVLYGFGTLDEMISCGADYLAETPSDVVSVLLKQR
ncbi:MAG: HAD family hydrolase [Clostridiales bacterium]|nr:HAD family hydrolase [Clostridiales bacterium]